MSSIHLPSFFNNAKPTPIDTKRMRFKRSTSQESMNTENNMPEYELGRSNTLTKKVKRFGSMLVRGKKSSRPNMPYFPITTIDLKKNDDSSFSFDSSDEDDLMTPTDPTAPSQDISTYFLVGSSQVSKPVTNSNDVLETCFSKDASSYTPIEDTRLKLNLALLVQHQLGDAFELADKDIEEDLELSRRAMLQSIRI